MNQDSPRTVTVDPRLLRAMGKLFLILLFFAFLLWLIPQISDILILTLIAVIISAIISPGVDWLERRSIPRAAGALIVLALLIVVISITFRFLIPAVREQAESINNLIKTQQPTKLIDSAQNWLHQRFPELNVQQLTERVDIGGKVNAFVSDFVAGSVTFLLNLASAISSMFVVLILTFLFLKDSRKIRKGIVGLIPNRYFEPGLNLMDKIQTQLSNYIRGQLTDALIVGILSVIGLWILGVKYAGFIGMIAGLANLIPYVGPVVGAIPAMFISIVNTPGEPMMLVYIAIMFAIVQVIDNSIVSPLVVSRSSNMHPITVILVILIGGSLGGAFGMLVAVPTYGIIRVTIQQIVWTLKYYRVAAD